MFKDLRFWWKYKGRHAHRNFIAGVKNLFKWFPIIWKDRDWDDHFIFEILKFKLKNQSKYIGRYDRHVSAKRDAEVMMTCVRLIDKIQTEYYAVEYMDYHKTEFHWDDCEDRPEHKQLRIEELEENFDNYFVKYPNIYKRVINTKKSIFKKDEKSGIAMNMAHINHERAIKLLFNIMEKNIERWWD
jgi:hypothetical protein